MRKIEGEVYWIKYYRHGKPYRESAESKKETDAKRLLRRREGEIADGKLPGVYFDKVRFDELAEDLLRNYEVNLKKSTDRLKLSISHSQKTYEGERIISIDTPMVEKYIKKRRGEGAANGTINRELSALKRMLRIGARQTPLQK